MLINVQEFRAWFFKTSTNINSTIVQSDTCVMHFLIFSKINTLRLVLVSSRIFCLRYAYKLFDFFNICDEKYMICPCCTNYRFFCPKLWAFSNGKMNYTVTKKRRMYSILRSWCLFRDIQIIHQEVLSTQVLVRVIINNSVIQTNWVSVYEENGL